MIFLHSVGIAHRVSTPIGGELYPLTFFLGPAPKKCRIRFCPRSLAFNRLPALCSPSPPVGKSSSCCQLGPPPRSTGRNMRCALRPLRRRRLADGRISARECRGHQTPSGGGRNLNLMSFLHSLLTRPFTASGKFASHRQNSRRLDEEGPSYLVNVT